VFPLFILFLLSSVLSPFPQLANINACIMVERSICVVYIKHQLLALFHYHDGWKTCCSDQVANKAYALVCCLLMHSKTIQLRPQHSVWDLSVIRRWRRAFDLRSLCRFARFHQHVPHRRVGQPQENSKTRRMFNLEVFLPHEHSMNCSDSGIAGSFDFLF